MAARAYSEHSQTAGDRSSLRRPSDPNNFQRVPTNARAPIMRKLYRTLNSVSSGKSAILGHWESLLMDNTAAPVICRLTTVQRECLFNDTATEELAASLSIVVLLTGPFVNRHLIRQMIVITVQFGQKPSNRLGQLLTSYARVILLRDFISIYTRPRNLTYVCASIAKTHYA